ncbi:MAG: hypothetical protein HC848_07590 [Limnobacter sp.]|nr:hypothetical protein [Limnobacter sp.]
MSFPGLFDTQIGLWIAHPQHDLAQTVCAVYGVPLSSPEHQQLTRLLQHLNPEVFNANSPLRSKVLIVPSLHAAKSRQFMTADKAALAKQLQTRQPSLSVSKSQLQALLPPSPLELEAMRVVMGFQETFGLASQAAGIHFGTLGTLSGRQIQNELREFARWAEQKAHFATTSDDRSLLMHFDARQQSIVDRIKKRLGPLERTFFNGKSSHQALFQGVPQSLLPDPINISALKRVQQLAQASKMGGIALIGVDVATTCMKLAATPEPQKVETAYREIGGFFGSLMVGGGVALSVAAMATPVGWVAAIVLTAGASYAGQELGSYLLRYYHKNNGDFFALKEGRILNDWCSIR